MMPRASCRGAYRKRVFRRGLKGAPVGTSNRPKRERIFISNGRPGRGDRGILLRLKARSGHSSAPEAADEALPRTELTGLDEDRWQTESHQTDHVPLDSLWACAMMNSQGL